MPPMSSKHLRLWAELTLLGVGMPLVFFFAGNRMLVHIAMWICSLLAVFYLQRQPGFSWARLWNGVWLEEGKVPQRLWLFRTARFALACAACIGMVLYYDPVRLFWLPQTRPGFWAIIMVLYPLLSVLPQEILYRAYFFERYRPIFQSKTAMVLASAALFGFVHVIFHNWVAPTLSLLGGLMFAASYARDKSLKWAVAEHALYGCMIFTIGIGTYFFYGLK